MKKIIFIVIFLVLTLAVCFGIFIARPYRESLSVTRNGANRNQTEDKIISKVVILPHILSAEDIRATVLKQAIDKGTYKTVVIITANHRSAGSGDIQIYPESWQMQNGDLLLNKQIYDNIVSSQIAAENKQDFVEEYGITNILPSVSKYLPEASYLMLMINNTSSQEITKKLVDTVYNQCRYDCLIVASTNLSQFSPIALSNVHDQYTVTALENFDYEAIWRSESDSPQSLYLATKLAELIGTKNLELTSHSNTGDADTAHDIASTGYICGFYSTAQADKKKLSTFIIGGDTMLDRDVWHNYKKDGIEKVFSGLGSNVFGGVDLSMLNLEGPISDIPISDDYPNRSLVFNMPPTTINALKSAKINAVSLANNHTLNAGVSGFATTQRLLKEAGINYAGRQVGFDKNEDILRIESSITMSILPIDALTLYDKNIFNQAISTEKQAGRFVIIMPHWGEEYNQKHNTNQENLAKSWIIAGADMVIGSHPHVIQDMEIVDGKPVIYSLGNLVFDQYFSKPTQESIIVAGIVAEDKVTLSILPTVQNKSIPSLASGDSKTRIVNYLLDENLFRTSTVKKIGFDTIEIAR